MSNDNAWPPLTYDGWSDTCAALHLWTQIIGKYRLSHTPWINHAWQATLYVTPRGLTTGAVPDVSGSIAIALDVCDDLCRVEAEGGRVETFPLEAMSIATFLGRTRTAVETVGGRFAIHGAPNELPEAVPFAEDTASRPYDADAVRRFHAALVRIQRVFATFRTAFLGKVSPVHLFWGSFDLAVTRFSGRVAPPHPGGIPNLPDAITREAYSHEVSSAGFWPGSGVGEPMFYSYAYPTPNAFCRQSVEPAAATWNDELGEFVLPYEAVRTADDPEATLMAFLESTYRAVAETADWDRNALECEIGRPGEPRLVPDR